MIRICAVLSIALAIAACGKKGDPIPPQDTAKTEAPAE
ncbi:MAG: lipoprotein [Pseudomonadota bacterium]